MVYLTALARAVTVCYCSLAGISGARIWHQLRQLRQMGCGVGSDCTPLEFELKGTDCLLDLCQDVIASTSRAVRAQDGVALLHLWAEKAEAPISGSFYWCF